MNNTLSKKTFTIHIYFLILLSLLGSCSKDIKNFSQFPGFKEYFKAHPPLHELPNKSDQILLKRYKPIFMLPPGHKGLIDFYKDYIGSGYLMDGKGNVISEQVTREMLNRYKHDPNIIFVHKNNKIQIPGKIFGRVTREPISFNTEHGKIIKYFTFLTYHAVFPASGILSGIPFWQEFFINIIGDINDWHQLDHYTSITIVLEGDGYNNKNPIAIILQQHNGLHTYLVGENIKKPEHYRFKIDVAIRSNELYPHNMQKTKHRAVSMPNLEGLIFLITGENKPWLAGYDITEGVIDAFYTLEFLHPDDAFYTFKGFLGERRFLRGRSGPPGADYNTLPGLKPMGMQLFAGYWHKNNIDEIKLLDSLTKNNNLFKTYIEFAKLQGDQFYKNWQHLRNSIKK